MSVAALVLPNIASLNPVILWGFFALCALIFYFKARGKP
jgi:hypothetical protein